jgi:hypothetical protein
LDWDDLSLNGDLCQVVLKNIVNHLVEGNVWNCFTNWGTVHLSGRILLLELVIILSKLADGFTSLTCIGSNYEEVYILNVAGHGNLNCFLPDCNLILLPVSCAICWTFELYLMLLFEILSVCILNNYF